MSAAVRNHLAPGLLVLLVGLGVACTMSESRSPGGMGSTGSDASTTGAVTGSSQTGSGVMTGAAGSVIPTGAAGSTGAAGTGVFTGAAGMSSTGAAGTVPVGTGAAGTGAAGTFVTGAAGMMGGSSDGGASDGLVFCQVSINPAGKTGSLFGLEYGPSASMIVHASVIGFRGGTPTWDWKVGIVGTLTPPPFTVVDGDPSTIEIKLVSRGNYAIKAEIVGAPECNLGEPIVVAVADPSPPSFVFRVTPPSGARLPTFETVIKANEVARRTTLDLGSSEDARVVSIAPADALRAPLPSYVRITGPFTFDLEYHTGRGPFVTTLAADLEYDLLIIPDGAVAPIVVRGRPDLIVQKMSVPEGMLVTGEARDGANAPVVGAHVLLRGDRVPSTVGLTDAAGRFGVSTRQGTLSAVIAPPAGSGLPEAHVAADPGIDLRGGTRDMKLFMKWAAAPAGRLALTVRGLDGKTPVAGAIVRVDSSAEIPSVGTVTLRASGIADVELNASGSVRAETVTDGKGLADLGVLPEGSYRLIVVPPDDAAATTSTTIALPAAGLSRDVALSPLVTVAGALVPVGQTAGTRVTAIDTGVLAAATSASAIADADGRYTLRLSPSRTYELLVEPPPGQGLARSVVALVTPGASPQPRTDTVPAALPWPGTITSLRRRVAGAVVQVFCSSCLDTSLAVAQGVTRADGTLELVVPAPPSAP